MLGAARHVVGGLFLTHMLVIIKLKEECVTEMSMMKSVNSAIRLFSPHHHT